VHFFCVLHIVFFLIVFSFHSFIEPQPSYSAYREASFGHAILELKNRTHAHYTWHRNQDDIAVASDFTWFFNRYWFPKNEGI